MDIACLLLAQLQLAHGGTMGAEALATALSQHALMEAAVTPAWVEQKWQELYEGGDFNRERVERLARRLNVEYVALLKERIRKDEERFAVLVDELGQIQRGEWDARFEAEDTLETRAEAKQVAEDKEERGPEDVEMDDQTEDMEAEHTEAEATVASEDEVQEEEGDEDVEKEEEEGDEEVEEEEEEEEVEVDEEEQLEDEDEKQEEVRVQVKEDDVSDVERRRFASQVLPLLANMSSHRFANLFAEPITDAIAPSYSLVVQQPTDLKTIKAMVKDGRVCSMAAFTRALQLMITNAAIYNGSGSEVFDMALAFQQEIDSITTSLDDVPRRRSLH